MMQPQEEAFLKKLLETFAIEAQEHIENLSNGLLELQKSDKEESGKLIETLFREAHSLKGASRSVDIPEIEEVCKAIESVFGEYKNSGEKVPKELIESLLESVDLLAILAKAPPEKRREYKPDVQDRIKSLTDLLQKTEEPSGEVRSVKSETPAQEKPKPKTELPDAKTIRVPVERLNRIMLQTEEMLFVKIVSNRHIRGFQSALKEITELIKEQKTFSAKEMAERFKKIETMLLNEVKYSKSDARSLGIMVDRLFEDMKQALMLPFSTLFYALPKSVHDMAKSVGKEALFTVEGAEIEIDRRILEEMKDPLTHLLRNAIDHGIEAPDEREKNNKPREGSVVLGLKQKSASKVEISIRDDGRGIDVKKLIASALKRGIIDKEESGRLDTDGAMELIFRSGVTTSEIVTDLSGRGLGLAIVKEKVQRLGGEVSVRNLQKGGSEFSMLLPLTLATFRGVLLAVDEQKFIIPSVNVKRVMEIQPQKIKSIEGRETFNFNHQVIPFAFLRDILGVAGNVGVDENRKIFAVIIESAGEFLAVGVDEIIYEEEVMIKSLGKQLSRVRNISGAALLASDKPALIINAADLIKSAGRALKKSHPLEKEQERRKRRLLAVDDSPTTRILLKNLLEMAGYDVVSANDGLEAYEELKKGAFDLVVSDIDMPRMNGIELTESIRSDRDFSELPVILVTALESADDKERGMKAGADAYIIKSSFDQNNLMETIKWLIE